MGDITDLANTIYGEGASTDYNTMKMIGSSIINRVSSGRAKEFGSSIPEVAQKGYYAVSNPNVPYKQAIAGKFPDKASETAYKQALAVASGLIKGTIQPDKVHFYFTDKEINKLKKNPKRFDFKRVKPTGEVGQYKLFSY